MALTDRWIPQSITLPPTFPLPGFCAHGSPCRAVFFILGCGTGLWAVHIPLVAARLDIDHSVVGLALLTAAIGAVGTMPLTGIALGRLGSRMPTTDSAFAVFAS